MTNIRRYRMDDRWEEVVPAEEPDGEWVKYDDIKHLLHPEPGGDHQYEVRANEEGIAAVYLQGRRVELPVFELVFGPSAVCALVGCHSGDIHMHSVGLAIQAMSRGEK